MNNLVIVSYAPLIHYPTTKTMVDHIKKDVNVNVVTTKPFNGTKLCEDTDDNISYAFKKGKSKSHIIIWLYYIWFVIYTLGKLVKIHPDTILYIESISAYPCYLYKRFFNKKTKVFVHYHEYTSPKQYISPGFRLFAMNHNIERKWLYYKLRGVSQTNKYRLLLFLKDNPMIPLECAHVLPNYPPKSWLRKKKRHDGDVVRCVYVGSLSLEDTFIYEFCQWVNNQHGRVTFDVYSFNFYPSTIDAINTIQSKYINFHKEGIPYDEIPNLFDNFDVGVLLYKANSINFQYNETNKFYEYLICGLDVWYPKEMLLLHDLDKSQFAPSIKEMDFSNMDKFDGSLKQGVIDNSQFNKFAEDTYGELLIRVKA